MSRYAGYSKARAEANARYNTKTYTQELFKLSRECPTSYDYPMVALSNEGVGKEELLALFETYLADNEEEA